MTFSDHVDKVDRFVWGPIMLVLVGTGIFLTIRTGFLPWRNLGYALRSVLSKEARTTKRGTGDVSPFSVLMTALAATISTGNIVGVATALAAGGFAGTITTSNLGAARYGAARGCFFNEAGIGSAAITAASATTDNPVRQSYINMTGTFFDTIVICSVTGLAICSSGVLGSTNADGTVINGSALTILAFRSVLGEAGAILVTIGIALFAFSTIIGWEYHGEKAFEYLFGMKPIMLYCIAYALVAFVGATQELAVVWNISDIFNALMAIPNLVTLLLLSGTIAKDMKEFQLEVALHKKAWKEARRPREKAAA